MRVYTNEKFIKRRAKIGQIAQWGGMGILAIGMVISFRTSPGSFTRIVNSNEQIVSSVTKDRNGVAFMDYVAYQEITGPQQPAATAAADATAQPAAKQPDLPRVLPIDGITPSDETLSAGTYPIVDGSNAVVVLVSPQNTWVPAEGVTMDQLSKIFNTQLVMWSEVDSTWSKTKINRFAPPTDSAAFQTFVAKVMTPIYGEQGEQLLLQTTNSNYTWALLATIGTLILGFIAASIGGYNTRRFGRSPRPDERIAKELKGFDDRYSLHVYSTPASFVFLGPSGIYTFAVREHGGKIVNTGDKWQHKGSRLNFLLAFSNEGIGNPSADAIEDAARVKKFLAEQDPDTAVDVQPLVLMANPNAQLELKSPVVPVIKPDGLKALLRMRAKDHRLDNPTLQKLESLLAPPAA
jgi:hypothetical protein